MAILSQAVLGTRSWSCILSETMIADVLFQLLFFKTSLKPDQLDCYLAPTIPPTPSWLLLSSNYSTNYSFYSDYSVVYTLCHHHFISFRPGCYCHILQPYLPTGLSLVLTYIPHSHYSSPLQDIENKLSLLLRGPSISEVSTANSRLSSGFLIFCLQLGSF